MHRITYHDRSPYKTFRCLTFVRGLHVFGACLYKRIPLPKYSPTILIQDYSNLTGYRAVQSMSQTTSQDTKERNTFHTAILYAIPDIESQCPYPLFENKDFWLVIKEMKKKHRFYSEMPLTGEHQSFGSTWQSVRANYSVCRETVPRFCWVAYVGESGQTSMLELSKLPFLVPPMPSEPCRQSKDRTWSPRAAGNRCERVVDWPTRFCFAISKCGLAWEIVNVRASWALFWHGALSVTGLHIPDTKDSRQV